MSDDGKPQHKGKSKRVKKGKPNMYRLNRFYNNTVKGTVGREMKRFKDPDGNEYIRLYFGKNLTDQKLIGTYPIEALDYYEEIKTN
jgi:hypothetical protein